MQYLSKIERDSNNIKEIYTKRELLDIVDEIGDEIFFLLNESNTLFEFRDKLNCLIVATPEGNRVYDIIRRLINRLCDFVKNIDEIDCDVIKQMSVELNMTYEEMAGELNCSVSKIKDMMYKCRKYKKRGPEKIYDIPPEELKKLLEEGKTRKEIAKHFGCSVSCLNKRIRRYRFNNELEEII